MSTILSRGFREGRIGRRCGLGRVPEELGMTEGAVKVAVHRLRRRYRELLKEEIAQTVADPAEIDEELRELFAAVGSHKSMPPDL